LRPVERVAVITDIHANLPALDAVLDTIDRTSVDAVYCGGDLVGYGPHPNEVCALIEERGIPTIYGNYDYAIARDLENCGCAYRDQHDRELGQLSVAWTLQHTNERSKDFMRGLPFDLRFELGRNRVRLVHGSPRKVNEYLFADKPARTFERIAEPKDGDPRAAFALLRLDGDRLVADIERVNYDAAAVGREVEAAGLPGEYAEKLVLAA